MDTNERAERLCEMLDECFGPLSVEQTSFMIWRAMDKICTIATPEQITSAIGRLEDDVREAIEDAL